MGMNWASDTAELKAEMDELRRRRDELKRRFHVAPAGGSTALPDEGAEGPPAPAEAGDEAEEGEDDDAAEWTAEV
ncbi:hypothetical protein [Caldinitratiruptor microaerophilus]|uniref:Uncharacterized protein n=1 Tax=Caldinitratiruptor microaerophilus TaxID=671077 RepID=A0AA35CJJ0_9FIRM|nr:hypothetical protein [Caldinitratiruptor microaerophilus]BDG59634.1 hypothetical protein caldi_07240 [Caldinitratiruptor microaerophilus]